jgi:hypothetical protein
MPRWLTSSAISCVGLGCFLATPAAAQIAPTGWSMTRNSRGVESYLPSDVVAGEAYLVAVLPIQSVDTTVRRDTWLRAQADADVATIGGRIVQSGGVSIAAPRVLTTSRTIAGAAGRQMLAVYFRVEPASGQGRLVRVLASSSALLQRYNAETLGILRGAASSNSTPIVASVPPEQSAAQALPPQSPAAARPPTAVTPVADNDDVSRIPSVLAVKTPAPRRSAVRPGGRLRVGTYAGQQITSTTGEVRGELTLSLYANGEYRQSWKGSTNDPREEHFGYDPATGRIDLDWGSLMEITNSRINPDDDFAVMGVAPDGTPILYAENDRGFSTTITVLRYVGANQQPSPSARAAAVLAAETEAARYKYVVPAGRGIQDAQIADVYLHSVMHQTMGLSGQLGVSSTLTVYLLLTDGTIHDGIPVATDEMDVTTSRRREPETWGRWRRQGSEIVVQWNVSPNEWKPLEGERMRKLRPTDVLRGRFSGGESRAAGDVSSYSLYGVTFGPNGQFEMDSRGGTGTGAFTQTMGGTSVQTTRDDNGSVTTASTPSVVVSGSSTNANADRAGTYTISGWNVELRFGSGRVVRQPVFFLDDKLDAIYWDERVMTLSRER